MNNLFLLEYDIESLAKAIYCITSWFPNRRFLGIVDKLNRDFISNESKILGANKIDTYSNFINFFNKVIENYIPEFSKEEFPIDVGNVRFYSNNRFHKVFIGNGSEDTYETLFIIESLIHDFDQFKEVWYEILNYEDSILSLIERSKNEFIQEEFECPPENYFNLISEHFNVFCNNRLAEFFQNFTSKNDELYPFFTPQYKLPVFLPLMKETFIEKVEGEIDKTRFEDSIWLSFWRRLNCNFPNFFERGGNSFFNLRLIHKETKEKIDLENTLAFLFENRLIILEQSNNPIPEILKSGIVDNKYQIAGLSQDAEVRRFEFKLKSKILFLGVDTHRISPNLDKNFLFEEKEDNLITASALIGLINAADSFKELVDYFAFYDTNKDRIMSITNGDAIFHAWKSSNYVINEGASPLMLVLFAYDSVHYNFEIFDKIALNFPFDVGSQFYNIHSWKIVDKEPTDLSLISKANFGSVDIFSDGKKKIIYQELHFILEDLDINDYEMIKSYNEIVLNALERNKKLILSNCEKDIVEINVVSRSVLDRNSSYRYPLQETKYFSKIVIDQEFNHQITLVAPHWDKIFEDNISKTTLEFENTILLNLLEGFFFKDRSGLLETIKQTDNNKRTSRVFEVKVDYFVQPILDFSVPEIHSFKGVRKDISRIIKKLNLHQGIYSEKEDIIGLVRRFRNEIREDLVSKIALYNQDDLNIKLQNELSSIIFNIDIQKRRLTTFSIDGNLQNDKLNSFRKQAIDLREESRVYKPILEYLIEENLITERTEPTIVPNNNNVKELVAYGKYILDFQLLSDAYSYGASNWFQLEIEENYVINISETEKNLQSIAEMKEAKYTYGEYTLRDDEIDSEMIGRIKKSFFQDTNIDFDSFIYFLSIFSSNGDITELRSMELLNIHGNVVQGKAQDLAQYFLDSSNYSIEHFYGILKFLAFDKNKVADSNGVIPIWEKKKRDNKFSSKPIIVNYENITFSPIMLDRLKKDWVDGFMNFILPYDIGMDKTKNIINQWKKKYEKKIVQDVRKLFNADKYVVFVDKELYKLDSQGNHPRDLGDYDLIVIDNQLKEILLFEVKYMRLSQTMKDSMRDQDDYFSGKRAKGLQFKSRVEYFEANLDKICQNLGLEENYSLKSYFLTNKIIRSNFVEFPFEIISFNELQSRIIG